MYLSKSQFTVPEASVVQMMGQFTVQYLQQQACRGFSEGSSCSSFRPTQSSTQFDFLPHPPSSSTKSQLPSNHGRLEKLEKRMQKMESIFSQSLDRINENTLEKMNEKSEQNEFRINKQSAEVTQRIKKVQEQNKQWLKQISDKLEAEMREKEEKLRKELAEERQSFQKERESMSLFQQQLIRDKIEMKKKIEEEMTKMIQKEKKEAESIRRQNASQIFQDIFRLKLREEKINIQKQIEQVSNFLGDELEKTKKMIDQIRHGAQIEHSVISNLMKINQKLKIQQQKNTYRELINLARKYPQKLLPKKIQRICMKENIICCLQNSDRGKKIKMDINIQKYFVFTFKVKIRSIVFGIGLGITDSLSEESEEQEIVFAGSNLKEGFISHYGKQISVDIFKRNDEIKVQVDLSEGMVTFTVRNQYGEKKETVVLEDTERKIWPFIYLHGRGDEVALYVQ